MDATLALLSILIGIAYVITAFVIFHRVLPLRRKISIRSALAYWLLAVAIGWFGLVLIAEVTSFGLQLHARLLGHALILTSTWLRIRQFGALPETWEKVL